MSMTSSRAYIMRALYEWILDNDCTPYVLVNALGEDVAVPQQYVKDGQIILNISPTAVSELSIHNDAVFFNGRFGGIATDVHVPIASVIGIYARENGQGMVFDHEESPLPEPPPGPPPPASPIKGPHKPSLKVVK